MRALIIFLLSLVFAQPSVGQNQDTPSEEGSGINKFLTPADSLSKPRLRGATIATAAGFTGMMVVLDQAWYSQFEQQSFTVFNDNDNWLQQDKIGHVWTTYQGGRFGKAMLVWAGVDDKKATWYGGPVGLVFMTGVEVLDGFSSGWGFSPGDMLANVGGTALFMSQEFLWSDQRIQLKFSAEPTDFIDDPLVNDRLDDLFGSGIGSLLDDYNAQTYWLSINPASFMDESTSFPKWLNLALGYSGEGMLGARFNYWCDDPDISPEDCPLAQRIDFSNEVDRYRQFYVSFDADLTKIQTRSRLLKTLFGTINMVKVPAPAIEFSNGDVYLRVVR